MARVPLGRGLMADKAVSFYKVSIRWSKRGNCVKRPRECIKKLFFLDCLKGHYTFLYFPAWRKGDVAVHLSQKLSLHLVYVLIAG